MKTKTYKGLAMSLALCMLLIMLPLKALASDVAVSASAITGVTLPVTGGTPVSTIADTAEYTATIGWSPTDATFAADTAYTATITIKPQNGYTLTGVAENFFTVAGATTTTNSAGDGSVTAVFPKTAANTAISASAITEVTLPVTGGTPVSTIADTAEYTATIGWSPTDATFAADTAYTATITITPKAGYTLAGVAANFFTVAGATTTNSAGDGIVTAVFQPKVELGTTSGFAVLAGSTITNTGTTTISGEAGEDVGLSPGTSLTGWASVTMTTGTVYGGTSAEAILAKTDLITAYNDAAGRTPVTTIGTELGGLTLKPGVYNSASGTFQITGTLTLDGEGLTNPVFIFQMASTLITASGSSVVLENGSVYCRTFWQVGSSATLGTGSSFVGHIFALESITANQGATVQGQLLARNGAVTLDNNTITNGLCAADTADTTASDTAILTVIKHVVNNNSGKKTAADFTLYVTSSDSGVVYSAPGDESGTTYKLAAGNYVVSENTDDGYNASYIVDGVASDYGSIILTAGVDKTVKITNIDIAAETPATTTPTTTTTAATTTTATTTTATAATNKVYTPLINITKTPEPLSLPSGEGEVTYTYKVTNPGMVALSNVSVADDKVSSVNYVSGDINADNLLQPSETWIYTCKTTLNATTTNASTATGSANGMTATDTASATVVVAKPGVVVTPSGVTTGVVATPSGVVAAPSGVVAAPSGVVVTPPGVLVTPPGITGVVTSPTTPELPRTGQDGTMIYVLAGLSITTLAAAIMMRSKRK